MKPLLSSCLMFVAVAACGQTQATGSEAGRKEQQSAQLAAQVIGEWAPYSANYASLGDLTIDREVVSWGACSRVPFNVLRVEAATLIQLLRSQQCRLRGEASFLILEPSDKGLEVSICRKQVEFDKPRKERACSWGILKKKLRSD